jgi:hypothetical protein
MQTQIDTSDIAYERRHRKYETFEKRQRLREKEKLKHEQYKLKERIEQLRVMDNSAFLALPTSSFSPAPGVSEEDAATGLTALPGAHVNGAATYNEGERRRKEMLDIALALEARFRVLLPPERMRKPQPHPSTRENMASATPVTTQAPSRRAVSDAEVSEREEEAIVADGYNQRQDKIKIKLKLVGKDSASGSPAPTVSSRTSKRSVRTSLPPAQKPKVRQQRPAPSRSPTPLAAPEHIERSQPPTYSISERPPSLWIDIEGPDQEEGPGSESEEELTPPPDDVRSTPASEHKEYLGNLQNFSSHPQVTSRPPMPPQVQMTLPDTQPRPAPEINPDLLEQEAPLEGASEPPQTPPPSGEDKLEGSPMRVDIETLSELTPPPRLASPPLIETFQNASPSPQPVEVVRPRRRGRPPKVRIDQNLRLLELANVVQSISAAPPPTKRKKTLHRPSEPFVHSPQIPESDRKSAPATPSELAFPSITAEEPSVSNGVAELKGTPKRESPLLPSTAASKSPPASSSMPPPEYISSISASLDFAIGGRRRGPQRKGIVAVEYQSETGELRRTDSQLLITSIRGNQRQTQRHQTAFGVKVPEEIMTPYDFWLPDEYLPEEELAKYDL